MADTSDTSEVNDAQGPAGPGGAAGAPRWRVYTEDWDPAYGNAATFELEIPDDAVPAEDDPSHVTPPPPPVVPLAFIDGRRRVELSLWAEDAASGARIPGLCGAYAVGAVTIRPNGPAAYSGVRVGRLAVWGGGHSGDVVGRSGLRWASDSIAGEDPDQLLAHLQDRMRRAEGELALDAAEQGWLVVLDGPLNRIRSLHGPLAGYVKSHHRRIIPPADHALVPTLEVGQRTRMYVAGIDRYTCYLRVGNPGPGASPWSGIARLEFPTEPGIAAVAERASMLAAVIPRYAGVAHRDPRAPVNLTPVKNLEHHLSRCMGSQELCTRAAREAVMAGARADRAAERVGDRAAEPAGDQRKGAA